MKKILVLLLCLMVLTVTACTTVDPTKSDASKTDKSSTASDDKGSTTPGELPESYDLVIAMGAQTGSVYSMGIQMGEYLSKVAPGIRTTVKAGSSGTNILTTNTNQSHIAHTSTDNAYAAANELYPFEGKKIDDVKGMVKVMQNAFHLVVPADAPVNSIQDIVDQKWPVKISAGTKGSGIESMLKKLLAEYDVTYEDIESWGGKVEFLGFSEAVTLYKDGELNALTVASGIPYSHITDVSTARDVKLLPVPTEIIDKFSHEGYAAVTIPANSYKGQKEDIQTFGAGVILVASSQADEAIVYELTKWLNSKEGIEVMGTINKGFGDYMKGPETGIKDLENLGLHPGAERYYKEAGVVK